jgi:hypothetical protein
MLKYGDLVTVMLEDGQWAGRVGTVIHQKGGKVAVSLGEDEVHYFYAHDLHRGVA